MLKVLSCSGLISVNVLNPHCSLHTYRNIFGCWPIGFGTTQKARINRLMVVQDAIKIFRRIIFNVPCSTDYIVGICERYRKYCLCCFSGSPRCSSPLYTGCFRKRELWRICTVPEKIFFYCNPAFTLVVDISGNP